MLSRTPSRTETRTLDRSPTFVAHTPSGSPRTDTLSMPRSGVQADSATGRWSEGFQDDPGVLSVVFSLLHQAASRFTSTSPIADRAGRGVPAYTPQPVMANIKRNY
jgi:hypothetical protein